MLAPSTQCKNVKKPVRNILPTDTHCKTITQQACYTYNITTVLFGENILALLCKRQQICLRVDSMVSRLVMHVMTTTFCTFFMFFKISNILDFSFWPCFVRFLELWYRLYSGFQQSGIGRDCILHVLARVIVLLLQ